MYYYLFLGQSNIFSKNYTTAILNYRAAQKLIEKEPENYVNTLCISLVKEATLWSSYFDQNDHSLELQQKALDYSIKYNSPLWCISKQLFANRKLCQPYVGLCLLKLH